MPSIRKHGLGGMMVAQNTPGCEWGVYLTDNPTDGITMLFGDAFDREGFRIKLWFATIRVIVVDDSRIDPRKLGEDESFPGNASVRLYRGTIDITSLPVLTVEEAIPTEYRNQEPNPEKVAKFLDWMTLRKHEVEHGLPATPLPEI